MSGPRCNTCGEIIGGGWCRTCFDDQMSALRARVKELEGQVDDWKQEASALTDENHEAERLRDKLAEVEKERDLQRESADRLQAELAKSADALGDNVRMGVELDDLRTKLAEVENELQIFKDICTVSKIDAKDATIKTLVEALEAIRNAKASWQSNVGSYAGGETHAGFAHRLQGIARTALASVKGGE